MLAGELRHGVIVRSPAAVQRHGVWRMPFCAIEKTDSG